MKHASKFVIFLEYENLKNYYFSPFFISSSEKIGFSLFKNTANLEVFADRRLDGGLDSFFKHNPLISEE